MLYFPNAKINLGLHVIKKRSDGFHNIETVFYPIPLCDGLEITDLPKSISYQFSSSGIPIYIEDKNNIVCKAFELVNASYKIPPTAIHLHKNIPFGAGLGGGSSDAAFMIKMLNEKYMLNLSTAKMEELSGKLGSDCPFFIKNHPVFAEGKGEVFTNLPLNLAGFYILLIKPNIHISTQEAYANIRPKKPEISLKELIQTPLNDWKNLICNDFETSIFPNHPELKKIKNELYDNGAIYAAMSGSGSTLFGIFSEEPKRKAEWETHFVWSGKL